jgi:hypothetical protein
MRLLIMEEFEISVSRDREVFHYTVVNNGTDRCEFEVFEDGRLVCSFEPNEDEYIRICRNQGGLDEEVVYMIADQIEQHHL